MPLTFSTKHKFDEEGNQACQVCEKSVKGDPWVQLHDIKFSSGSKNWIRRKYKPSENGLNQDHHLTGPVLHLQVCLEQYICGLVLEMPWLLKRLEHEGDTE